MTINQRIKNELNIRGWSQYQLSKCTKIEQSTISKWFQAVPTTPSQRSIKKVAKAFGMTIGQLMSEETEADSQFQELKDFWHRLNQQEKDSVLNMIKTIVSHR
ncbi:MAG: helix-turn-helix transcriptional regulator [Clostridia bacterium]|nr:helix-turn-helix transcriptional regulator [Clostridia bacterium]